MKNEESTRSELEAIFAQRIAIMDGAMGTMIQMHKLEEADFRGKQFAHHSCDVKGNNDLLSITQPQIIEDIHHAYFEAGADIVETNTFNSNVISMADYQMESLVYDLNVAGAQAASSQHLGQVRRASSAGRSGRGPGHQAHQLRRVH